MIGRKNSNDENDDAPPFNFQVRCAILLVLFFQYIFNIFINIYIFTFFINILFFKNKVIIL